MRPLAVLAVLCASIALSNSASNPVVDFEARCVAVGPAEVRGILARDALIYLPYVAIFADGSRMSLDLDGTLEGMDAAQLAVQSFGDIGSECKTKMTLFVQGFFVIPCVEANGVAMPRRLCASVCNDIWDSCESLLHLLDYITALPTCGQGGHFTRFEAGFPDTVEGVQAGMLTPEEYHGTKYYSEGPTFVANGQEFSCLDLPEFNAMYGATATNESVSCSEQVLNCTGPLKHGRADLAAGECDHCVVSCPLAAFDSTAFMHRAEVYPAAMSVPLLLFLLVVESAPLLQNAAKRVSGSAPTNGSQTNPYMLLCVTSGLVHAGLVLVLMGSSSGTASSGCNADGVFASNNPELWASPEQQWVCASMRLSVHLLQLLLNSLACFMVHTLWKFQAAVNYSQSNSRTRGLHFDLVVILLLPALCTAATVVWGNEISAAMYDDFFAYEAVRNIAKCGPSFHSVWREWLFVEAPMLVAIVITMAAAYALKRLCGRIVKVAMTRSAQSDDTVSRAQVEHMQHVGAQMQVFSVGCFVLLIVRMSSTAVLRTRMQTYVDALSQYATCSHLDIIYNEGCQDPRDNLVGWEAAGLTANILCSSMIPPLFAAFFAGTLVMRNWKGYHRRMRRRVYNHSHESIRPTVHKTHKSVIKVTHHGESSGSPSINALD